MADLKPHEQRVVAEEAELSERLTKLQAFFSADAFKALAAEDQHLLREQSAYMKAYAGVLRKRIARFAP